MVRIKVRDYEPDRIWSAMRKEHLIRPEDFPTPQSFQQRILDAFRHDKYLRNLGEIGRRQVFERAFMDWQALSPVERLGSLLAMRERGLLTKEEYLQLAEEMGFDRSQAESYYQNWSGSEEAIWTLKYYGLLRYGEYGKLLHAKGLTYGAGYYRFRKWLALRGIRPFRKFQPQTKVQLKPKERKRLVLP